MPFFVYILKSSSTGRFYIGSTSDWPRRLELHQEGLVFATKPYRPWELAHLEEYATRGEAVRRERAIKRRKDRTYLELLCHRQSPGGSRD